MANIRKRSSVFESINETVDEEVGVAETGGVLKHDVEESPIEVTPPKPFVEEMIVPTEDLGPRFLEVESAPVKPVPAPAPKAPELLPAPKRRPRNVPRFSRTR